MPSFLDSWRRIKKAAAKKRGEDEKPGLQKVVEPLLEKLDAVADKRPVDNYKAAEAAEFARAGMQRYLDSLPPAGEEGFKKEIASYLKTLASYRDNMLEVAKDHRAKNAEVIEALKVLNTVQSILDTLNISEKRYRDEMNQILLDVKGKPDTDAAVKKGTKDYEKLEKKIKKIKDEYQKLAKDSNGATSTIMKYEKVMTK